MKTTHTPGPWYIHKDYYDNPTGENRQIMYKSGDAQHTSLCRVIQNPADAHLLAAAPELLAACELALKYLRPLGKDKFSETAEQTICAAIAKARAK